MSAVQTAIQPFVEHIRNALWKTPERGLASVMVGAGFSRNAEAIGISAKPFPLWDGLARTMAAAIGLDSAKPRDPLQIAQMYVATLGVPALRRLIESQIPDREYRPGDLHRRLMALPWADVFTTNYDTLLERTCSEVYDRHYETISAPNDIAMRRPPRLVKLHGTLGSGEDLIAAQEDYRKYPQTHAPFVNLVREAVMETVFVLLGFAGDDPNFLEWTGWVRDVLGSHAPRIFLCGLIDTSPAMRALLDLRGVTPVDFSIVAGEGTPRERHARAYDWFLAALAIGRPGRDLKWAPYQKVHIPVYDPPLPLPRVFSDFSEFHPNWTLGGAFDAKQLLPVAATWSAQRQEYPGWHVAPDGIRERIWSTTHNWRGAIFHRADSLSPLERLGLARELCWRLDLCLSPISTEESLKLESLLNSLNPFGAQLSLPGSAPVPDAENANCREAWLFLALQILHTAREDLDETHYAVWRQRLMIVGASDPEILGELHHEDALFQLNRLDLSAFRETLANWKTKAKQPLEKARLAALYAELGESAVALELAKAALSAVRTSIPTAATTSFEAWICLLLYLLERFDNQPNNQWGERMDLAKDRGYSPWETIQGMRRELASPRPSGRQVVGRTAGFDSGDIRESSSPAVSITPAFQLIRLTEKAPCPLYTGNSGVLGEAAAHAAVWIGDNAPFWSLATLLRAGASEAVLNEIFDRATVVVLGAERAKQLYTSLVRVIVGELSANVSIPGHSRGLGGHALFTGLEVLSRIALGLPPAELNELLGHCVGWWSHPSVTRSHEVAKLVYTLLERTIEALPDSALGAAIGPLLATPLFGERETDRADFQFIWPEPFGALFNRRIAPLAAPLPNWHLLWDRLVHGIRSENSVLRNRAFRRAYLLSENGWLSPVEAAALVDAVWLKTDPKTGLPMLPEFRRTIALHLPGGDSHRAAELLRHNLLDWEFKAWDQREFSSQEVESFLSWAQDAADIFRHTAVKHPRESVLPLHEADAEQLLRRLIAWWPSAIMRLEGVSDRASPFGVFDPVPVVERFCVLLGESLLLHLPPSHELAALAEKEFERLSQRGFSISRAIPGRVFQFKEQMDAFLPLLEQCLASSDMRYVRPAAHSIVSWNRGAQNSLLPPVPKKLIDVLIGRLTLRAAPGLDGVIQALSWIVEEAPDRFDGDEHEMLLLGLDRIADETAIPSLQRRFFRSEISRATVAEGLHIRSWAALLAHKIEDRITERQEQIPPTIAQWKKIRAEDPLPEVRRT